MCGVFDCKKIPYWGGAHQCEVRTSLHSRPMLKIDCPIFPKPLAQARLLFNPTYPHMCHNFTERRQCRHIGRRPSSDTL